MASLVADNPFDTQPASSTSQPAAAARPEPTAGITPATAPAPAGIIAQAAQFNPYTATVDRSTETAAGQLDTLLSGDSPLMQRARTLAQQQMAGRGLVNSSMAIEAGTGAMIDRAAPIAMQDAQTYDARTRFNLGSKNQAGMFNAGEQNKFALQGSDQAFTGGENQKQRAFTTSERMGSQDFQAGMQGAQQKFTAAQNELDRAQQMAIADKSIEANANLERARQSFQAAQNEMDRVQQLRITDITQQFQASQNDLNRQTQVYVQQLQEQGMDRRTAQQIAANMQTAQMNIAADAARAALQEAGIQNRFDQDIAIRTSQFNVEQVNADRRTIQAQEFQLRSMGFQAQLNRETVPTSFAADTARQTQASINAVLADGNLTEDARKGAIANIVNAANSQLDWASSFYGTTIPRVTAPGAPPASSGSGGGYSPPPPPPAPPAPPAQYAPPQYDYWMQGDAAGGAAG